MKYYEKVNSTLHSTLWMCTFWSSDLIVALSGIQLSIPYFQNYIFVIFLKLPRVTDLVSNLFILH